MADRVSAIPDTRAPLSRDRVLRAAIGLADKEGIASLSMRRLAQELGVEAMSLYHYFKSKDELLIAMIDLVYGEVDHPPAGADWKLAIRELAVRTHDALIRHRWTMTIQVAPEAIAPAQLRVAESLLAALGRAGLPADLADHAYHALDSHIVGFTLWQARLPFKKKGDLEAAAARFLTQVSADQYPHLVDHVHHHLTPAVQSGQSAFEFGLDLILDGIERLRGALERYGAATVTSQNTP